MCDALTLGQQWSKIKKIEEKLSPRCQHIYDRICIDVSIKLKSADPNPIVYHFDGLLSDTFNKDDNKHVKRVNKELKKMHLRIKKSNTSIKGHARCYDHQQWTIISTANSWF